MVKIRNILISVVLVIVLLAIIGYIGYLLTPKETLPKETPSTASPYELRINKIYYYKTGIDAVVILDLSARYNADGKWSVWGSGFKLLTDKGSVLKTVVLPFELRECFRNELLLSVDATKIGYTLFQVAFSISSNEKPVKLIYDAFDVKIELPITEDITSYVSYYDYVKVKLITKPPVSELDVLAFPSSWLVGCHIAGAVFSVSIDVKASSFMIGADKIAITKIEAPAATIVGVTPKPPIILSKGEEISVKLVLQAPVNFRYSGPLEVTLTMEPAK
ncbi:MAG: hypothetical protein QXL22_05420 [Candidatus Nezhaarchaeales archaeon]